MTGGEVERRSGGEREGAGVGLGWPGGCRFKSLPRFSVTPDLKNKNFGLVEKKVNEKRGLSKHNLDTDRGHALSAAHQGWTNLAGLLARERDDGSANL